METSMTQPVRVDEQRLWQVALVEGIFFVVAVMIIYFRHSTGAVTLRLPLVSEAAIGLHVGAALGALVGFGLLRSPLREQVVRSALPLRRIASSAWSIATVSLLAGVGEELFFRAALQTWIGLFWASILFGLAHSGTARLNEGLSIGKIVYLLSTVAAGALLGLLYQGVGLLASISAHAALDTVILLALAPALAKAGGPSIRIGSISGAT
jgi:membrane protease YdiL (CAAX protease family)